MHDGSRQGRRRAANPWGLQEQVSKQLRERLAARRTEGPAHAAPAPLKPTWFRWLALALVVAFAAVELALGWGADSSALLGDGIYELAAAISLVAVIIGARFVPKLKVRKRREHADARLAAALGWWLRVNAVAVIVAAGWTALTPETAAPRLMIVLGLAGVVVDLIAQALLGQAKSTSDRALRGDAFFNLVASLVAALAGVGVAMTDAALADTVGTLAIACLMLWASRGSVTKATEVLRAPEAPAPQLSRWRIALLGALGAAPVYTYVVYGPLVVLPSLSKYLGLDEWLVGLLMMLGTPVAAVIALPLTQRWQWLDWASQVALAVCALMVSALPDGPWKLLPFVLASMFFVAPFRVWTVIAKNTAGRGEQTYVTAMLTMITFMSFGFLAGKNNLSLLFGVSGAVLLVCAIATRRLTPYVEPRLEPVRTLIKEPWTAFRNAEVRLTAVMQGLSSTALVLVDGSITLALVLVFRDEGELLSAITGIAVLFGAFAGPALLRLRSLRARLFVSGVITTAAFGLFALFSAGMSVIMALVILVVARTLLEIGTTGTTASSPGVRSGDQAVMALMQLFRNVALFTTPLGAALVGLGESNRLGVEPFLFVVAPCAMLMIIYLWLARRQPRGTPIVGRTKTGALRFHSPLGDTAVITTSRDVEVVAADCRHAPPRSTVLISTGFFAAPPGEKGDRGALCILSGNREARVLSSDMLGEVRELSKGGDPDIAWDDDQERLILVVFKPGLTDAEAQELAWDLGWKFPFQEVYVAPHRLMAALRGRQRAARWFLLTQRRLRAGVFGRVRALRRQRQGGGAARSWTRTGGSMGVGPRFHGEIEWAAKGARITNPSWSVDPRAEDRWGLLVVGDPPPKRASYATRQIVARLEYQLGLSGASGVRFEDRATRGRYARK